VIDLHVHILPDLDDGPTDMGRALAMCRLAADDGTTTVVASPHMFNGMYDVARGDILKAVNCLREFLEIEEIDLEVLPGADVHAVPNLDTLVREGYAMTVGDRGKYMVTELPQDILPQGLLQLFFSIQLLGITPIISHPERNLEIQSNPMLLTEMVEAGTLVQLTAASITGEFGDAARKCAHALLEARLAHVVASDAHSCDRRLPGLSRAFAVAKELLPVEDAEEIFLHRPKKILSGEYIDLPEPVRPASAKKRRFSWRRDTRR
jgi:protein-tyrosine phosphatase